MGIGVKPMGLDPPVPHIAVYVVGKRGLREQQGDSEGQGAGRAENGGKTRCVFFSQLTRPCRYGQGIGGEGKKIKGQEKRDILPEVPKQGKGKAGNLNGNSGENNKHLFQN